MAEPGKYLAMKPMDLAVLLHNLHVAAKHPEIGHNDADESLQLLARSFNRKASNVKMSRVESGLYACNLLDEKGAFWHPLGRSFDEFLGDIANMNRNREPMAYNKFFNYFETVVENQLTLSDKPDTID